MTCRSPDASTSAVLLWSDSEFQIVCCHPLHQRTLMRRRTAELGGRTHRWGRSRVQWLPERPPASLLQGILAPRGRRTAAAQRSEPDKPEPAYLLFTVMRDFWLRP